MNQQEKIPRHLQMLINFIAQYAGPVTVTSTPPQEAEAPKPGTWVPVGFSEAELNLMRQWFNSMRDTNPKYVTAEDSALADKILVTLGFPVNSPAPGAMPQCSNCQHCDDEQAGRMVRCLMFNELRKPTAWCEQHKFQQKSP